MQNERKQHITVTYQIGILLLPNLRVYNSNGQAESHKIISKYFL